MNNNVLVDHQMQLEKLFNKNQLMSRLRQEFTEAEEGLFVKFCEHQDIDVKFGIDLLSQMALHKRCDLETLVGCLRNHFPTAQEVVDEIIKCAEADLVTYKVQLRQFIVIYEITADVQAELDRFQYPLPMIVPPKEVKNNKQSGYLCNNSSLILKNNHHDDDICLDHINRMNKIQLKLNMDTATMVQNSWSNLDKPKMGESREEFQKRVRAFNKYDETVHDVMAVLLDQSDVFYLTHKYDKRGRTYCQGHHVTYQGNAWNKAVIEFANEEEVTL